MRWKISSAKGSGTDYVGDAEATPITEALCDLWRKYIEDAAPMNAAAPWDHLRVEIWLDSGRVILFPTPSPYRFRVEKASCQITCPDLLDSYNEAAGSNMPDDKFEVWAMGAEKKVADLVSIAAKKAQLPERLGRPEVKVHYYSCGGDSGCIKEDVLHQT